MTGLARGQHGLKERLIAVVQPKQLAATDPLELKFRAVVSSVFADAWDYAFKVLGRDADATDEVMQEAMIAAWSRWHLLDPERQNERYYMSAVVSRCRNALRTKRAFVDLSEEIEKEEGFPQVPSLDLEYINAEDAALVQRAVSEFEAWFDKVFRAMGPRQKETFLLLYQDRSHAEIAEILGISIHAVEKNIMRARNTLDAAAKARGYRMTDESMTQLIQDFLNQKQLESGPNG